MSATKGTTRKAADDKKSKNDNNKNKKDSKSKMSKDEVEKMLAMKKRNDPKQQSKRSFVDIARGVTKSKPFVRKSSMNDDPVMVKNAQNFVNDTKNSSSVSRSHSDVIMKPNGLFQRSRLSDRQSHSNNDLRVNSRSNSIRHIDSDNERRSRNNSFSRNGSFHRYDDEDDYYPDDVIEEDSRYADKNRRQSSFKGASLKRRKTYIQTMPGPNQNDAKTSSNKKKHKTGPNSNSSSMSNRLSHDRIYIPDHSIEELPISEGEIFVEKKVSNLKNNQKKDENNTQPRGIMKRSLQQIRPKTTLSRAFSSSKETNERSSQTFVNTNMLNLSPRLSKESFDSSTESEKRYLHIGDTSNRSRSFSLNASASDFKERMRGLKPSDMYTLRKTFSQHLLLAEQTAAILLLQAQSPTDRRIGMQSLKILREMGRENNDSIQEQLLDTNSVTAAPSSNVPTKSHDDILHKIKTPFQNQILERRIQTLDADREVLRQLNKSLIEENESLKSFKISRSILSTDKEETPQLSRLKEFTQDIDASKENDISKEINDLKSVVTHLNRLSDFKEKQNTSRIDNAPTLFSHYNSNPCVADSNGIPLQQWDQLREQSKLVLEENQLLMDQKLLYKKTMDDLSSNYQEEVMRLSTQLSEGNRDKNRLEHMLDDRDLELSLLREKYESITDRNENRMEKSEHDTKVERLHKNYMYEVSTLKSEVEKLNNTIEAQNKEKSRLAMQVTDLTATNSRLLMELKIAEKNFRKSEKRVIQCMSELEEIYGKEIVTKGTLAQVLKMAEKTSVEKEQMTLLVEAQKEKTQEALEQIHHDDLTLQDLRRQLKNTKERRKNQFSKIKQRIMDQGQEVSSIVNKYEKELGQLQNVVRQKQRFIDRIQCDKSVTEHRLDEMYNSLNNHSDMKYNQFT